MLQWALSEFRSNQFKVKMAKSFKVSQWLLFVNLVFIIQTALPVSGQLSRVLSGGDATICPGDSVEYVCDVEQFGDTTTLSWSIGNIVFPSFVRIRGIFNATEGDTRSSPQLPGVIANLTEITETRFTSILTIDAAGVSVANQTVIRCSGTGGLNEQAVLTIKANSEVINVQAPNSPGLEINNVTVSVQLCTATAICVDVPNTAISENCQLCSSSPCINVLPQSLNLCQNNYTIVAYSMDNNALVSTVVIGDTNSLINGRPALSEVVGVQSTSSSLLWSPPTIRPDNCITGYEISWDGGSFVYSPSDEDMPSVGFDVLTANGFPVCEPFNVTISPFLPALGVLRDKAADFSGVVVPGSLPATPGQQELGYSAAIAVSVVIPAFVTFILGLAIGTAITFFCTRQSKMPVKLTEKREKQEEQSMI